MKVGYTLPPFGGGLQCGFHKWYILTGMAAGEQDYDNAPEVEPNISSEDTGTVPIGIARVRAEWLAAGLVEHEQAQTKPEVERVLFTEVDGGAGIGDYTLECEHVQNSLALSDDAMERLLTSGELDSILVQGPDGKPRRLVSESSVNRFQEDAAIDPGAIKRAAKAMADQTVVEAINTLQGEIGTQTKVLQQMKDMLLLEVRNLKEQDRDLTSFVYELAEEIQRLLPKKKR